MPFFKFSIKNLVTIFKYVAELLFKIKIYSKVLLTKRHTINKYEMEPQRFNAADSVISNRLRAIWPKGYQRGTCGRVTSRTATT